MNMKTITTVTLMAILSSTSSLQAQFLKKLMDETTDKVADKMADKLSDRIAEEIAYAIMKPIDKALDSMLRHSYEQDSLSGSRKYRDYSAFLGDMNRNADVPDQYVFNLSIRTEVEDDKKKKTEVTFHYTDSGDYLGIEQTESILVMDTKNDIMVTYNKKDDSAMALPNMMSLGAAMMSHEINEEAEKFTYEKTGKTKKICGYKTYEYKGTIAEESYKLYMAEDFPISWVESYSAMFSEMAPTLDLGKWNEIEGMMLKSETKENGKQVSKSEAKDVNIFGMVLSKSDYTFGDYEDK